MSEINKDNKEIPAYISKDLSVFEPYLYRLNEEKEQILLRILPPDVTPQVWKLGIEQGFEDMNTHLEQVFLTGKILSIARGRLQFFASPMAEAKNLSETGLESVMTELKMREELLRSDLFIEQMALQAQKLQEIRKIIEEKYPNILYNIKEQKQMLAEEEDKETQAEILKNIRQISMPMNLDKAWISAQQEFLNNANWQYFLTELDYFQKSCFQQDPKIQERKHFYSSFRAESQQWHTLPVQQQILNFVRAKALSFNFGLFSKSDFSLIEGKLAPEVLVFWEKYEKSFHRVFNSGTKVLPAELEIETESTDEAEGIDGLFDFSVEDIDTTSWKEIYNDVFAVPDLHLENESFKDWLLHELFTNEKQTNLYQTLSKEGQEVIHPVSKKTFKEKIIGTIENISEIKIKAFDILRWQEKMRKRQFSFNQTIYNPAFAVQAPQNILKNVNSAVFAKKRFKDLTKSEQKQFLLILKEELQTNSDLQAYIQRMQLEQSFTSVNKQISPFLQLHEKDNGLFIPQWECVTEENKAQMQKMLEDIAAKKAKELSELRKMIQELIQTSGKDGLAGFEGISWNFSENRALWEKELEKKRQEFWKGRQFDIQTMQDFGILNQNFEGEPSKEDFIYLQELKNVVESIRPYLGKVKRTFAQTLPSTRKMTIDTDRHVQNGLIVDRNALRDPVLKATHKISHPPKIEEEKEDMAASIWFNIDESGSMRNEKARKAFKLITLMILGLEGRDAYMGLNFFGVGCYNAFTLTNDYIGKNVLFKILKRLTIIKNGKLFYYPDHAHEDMYDALCLGTEEMVKFRKIVDETKTHLLECMFTLSDGQITRGVRGKEFATFVESQRAKYNIIYKGFFLKGAENDSGEYLKELFGEKDVAQAFEFSEIVDLWTRQMVTSLNQQKRNKNK